MHTELLLSASLGEDARTALRGFIDRIDPDYGIAGWALDMAAPERAPALELLADEVVLARITPRLPRPDIVLGTASPASPGFRFEAALFSTPETRAACEAGARLRVRVAGTDWFLRAAAALPQPAAFAAQVAAAEASRAPPAELPEAALTADLGGALRLLARSAEALLLPKATPAGARPVGFIEAMCCEPQGHVWLFGWMKQGHPLHCPALLAFGDARHPAGCAILTHDRDDLPPDACGIVAVLATDWVPSGQERAPLLVFGDAADKLLPASESFTLLSASECGARFAERKAQYRAPHAQAMIRLYAQVGDWSPDPASAASLNLRAHVDRVMALPGFGCLVEGWVLSPVQKVAGMALRVGNQVLALDSASLSRKPRPDLLAATANGARLVGPSGARMVATAGFLAAFTGPLAADAGDGLTLKLLLADGRASNHAVPLTELRVLGQSAGFEEVLHLFPAAAAERFFPPLARAISTELGREMRSATPHEAAPARRVLVVALPDDPHDLALMATELALLALSAAPPPAVALLARAGEHRPRVLTLFQELRQDAGLSASLFFIADPDYALHALSPVLAALGAERFAFVAPGLFPSAAGWSALLAALAGNGDEPLALTVERIGRAGAVAAECFAWTRAGFTPWLARQPVLLGGAALQELALPAGTASVATASCGRQPERSRFADQVNASLRQSRTAAEVAHA